MSRNALVRYGGLTAVACTVLAATGLVVFLTGAALPDPTWSVADLAHKTNSFTQAVLGAWILMWAMVVVVAFAGWVAHRYGSDSVLVRSGAGVLVVGGVIHAVENLLVAGLYGQGLPAIAHGSGVDPGTAALSRTVDTASTFAFGVLGLAILLIALGLRFELGSPTWFAGWGLVAGVMGLLASLGLAVPALSGLAGPFNVLMLSWLCVLGVRAAISLTESNRLMPTRI
jgi:hypothetical protein